MRIHTKILLLAITMGSLLPACGDDHRTGRPVVISGLTMGTDYTVKIKKQDKPVNAQKVRSDIDNILERLNNQMSTYIESSELSRINQSGRVDWIPVSDDLLTVIEQALIVSRLSDGAFDITVGPVVNLWGFGPGPRMDTVPDDKQIKDVLHKVGYRHLETRHNPPSIKKARADLYIDLSGIAKGYAVDVLADYLERLGIENYLVDIGGEVRARGNNPEGTNWRIGIEKPVISKRAIQRVVRLDDAAMATSGDYRNYFEEGGTRYSHTIDPNTGKPISHKLVSVTVITPVAMYADALATAFMVLGPDKGYQLAEQENLAVLFIIKTDDGFAEHPTQHFNNYMAE